MMFSIYPLSNFIFIIIVIYIFLQNTYSPFNKSITVYGDLLNGLGFTFSTTILSNGTRVPLGDISHGKFNNTTAAGAINEINLILLLLILIC
jgi:hypothetical protein